jgi:hypothetical protein
MRIYRLRNRRSDLGEPRSSGKRTSSKQRPPGRLYLNPPPQVGDALITPDGRTFTLIREFAGRARIPIAKNKKIIPRVLVWGFVCSACGSMTETRKVASEKPAAKKCSVCIVARRRKLKGD